MVEQGEDHTAFRKAKQKYDNRAKEKYLSLIYNAFGGAFVLFSAARRIDFNAVFCGKRFQIVKVHAVRGRRGLAGKYRFFLFGAYRIGIQFAYDGAIFRLICGKGSFLFFRNINFFRLVFRIRRLLKGGIDKAQIIFMPDLRFPLFHQFGVFFAYLLFLLFQRPCVCFPLLEQLAFALGYDMLVAVAFFLHCFFVYDKPFRFYDLRYF